ncbi:hypothetical protein [Maribacter sp. 2308TA10-17]|uniref:hypothetical protein n=1 Tax=Maribacter sp. 2308TA10-17 TaxID=3386276 RepID=UPI0039BD89F5
MIAFYVQGGGLGHLSRTHKLIQYLEIDSKDVLIITPSAFKHHFKQYQFIPISWNSSPAIWSNILIEHLTKHNIQFCYIDTFPLGMKGELISVYKALPKISFVYTCRILKWEKYLNDMPETFAPNFFKTILLENLSEVHVNWIKAASKQINKVLFPISTITEHKTLAKDPYGLIIHSGGIKDVISLCTKVKAVMPSNIKSIFVFTQVTAEFDDKRFQFRIQEYPVQAYFKNATHIYTAAGFNLINELASYHEKHTIFPIERLYDDQFFRAKNSGNLLAK